MENGGGGGTKYINIDVITFTQLPNEYGLDGMAFLLRMTEHTARMRR